ncbi:MAG: sigma-E processing peptidase SpoIIGA [Porcipelethomonas sp.]
MKTIYLDVLIVLNIYVNFFLLKGTARFTHTPLKTSRCIISSVIGSLFSLAILLPSGSFLLSLIIKLAAAAVITAITFGIKDRRKFLRLLLYFYIINFIFAGVVMLLYITFKPSFMAFNNSYFYVDFSLISLVIFTAVAYFAVTAVRYFMDRGADSCHKYSVLIRYSEHTVKLDAIADTGNSLTDGFTGRPVIVCPGSSLGFDCEFSPDNAGEIYSRFGLRMIPYSTIGNTGMIPVFSPDELLITDEETGKRYTSDALVGIVSRETSAIFNPKLLI